MEILKRLILVTLLVLVAKSAYAKQTKVEVFYDSSSFVHKKELSGISSSYYQLDKPTHLQREMSKHLPNNLNDAASYMSKYANSIEGKKQIQAIVDGYQGVGRAYSLGVKKLPAIVIDERFVVYGTTDISLAVNAWNKRLGGDK